MSRRRPADGRQPGAARHPRRLGVEALAAYLVNEIQERLPPAGREDQRQAHRGDRPPDAAEGRDLRRRRHDLPDAASSSTEEFDEINEKVVEETAKQPATASRCCRASPRPACRPLVHLGGLVPGDHAGADRGGGSRQDRQPPSGSRKRVIVGRLIPAGTGAVMNRVKIDRRRRGRRDFGGRRRSARACQGRRGRGRETGGRTGRIGRLRPRELRGPAAGDSVPREGSPGRSGHIE